MDSRANIGNTVWKHVIASPEILKKYPTVIAKLRNGEYNAADLSQKIKTGTTVYTIKHNDKIRLLFTTIIEVGVNEPIAYITEESLEHKYKKCRSMKPGGVDKIIESEAEENCALYFAELEKNKQTSEKIVEQNSPPVKKNYVYKYVDLHVIGNEWLQLNKDQQDVLSHPGRFICHGTPGTGKSKLALALMAQAIALGLKVVYVTQSPDLCKEMQAEWLVSPCSKETPIGAATFATYEDLLREALQQEGLNKQLVGHEHCLEWIQNYINVYKKITNKETLEKFSEKFFYAKFIYAEFRIACGYQEDEYLSLGERQTLLTNKEEQQWVWKAYTSYVSFLESKHCAHPAFTSLSGKKKQMIIVDEGQDLSFKQSYSLCEYAEDTNIRVFYDDDQSLHDKISKQGYLQSSIKKLTDQQIEPLELLLSYRSAPDIIKVNNHIIDLQTFLDGGRLYAGKRMEGRPNDTRDGDVEWPEYNEELIRQLVEYTTKNKDCAVITLEEFKKEAKDIFGDQVYTIDTIKGLQYPRIFLYKFFSSKNKEVREYFEYVNLRLSTRTPETILNYNRPKQRNVKSETIWKSLNSSIARGLLKVIIVDKKRHAFRHITHYLLEKITDKHDKEMKVEKTSNTEWLEHAEKLRAKGKTEQADNIENTILAEEKKTENKPLLSSRNNRKKTEPVKKPQPVLNTTKKNKTQNNTTRNNTNANVKAKPVTRQMTVSQPIPIPIMNVKGKFPIEFDANNISTEVLTFLNDFMDDFEEKGEEFLEKLVKSSKAVKYLFGVRFQRIPNAKNKLDIFEYESVKPSDFYSLISQPESLRKSEAFTISKSNGISLIRYKTPECAMDGSAKHKLRSAFLYQHIFDNEKYAQTFFDYFCKTDEFHTKPNIFRLLPVPLKQIVLLIHNHNSDDMVTQMYADDVLKSLIQVAVLKNHAPFVKLILESNVFDFKNAYFDNNRILHLASKRGCLDVVNMLIESKRFNLDDSGCLQYETPLYLAAKKGRFDVVQALVIAGANINGNDKFFLHTPLLAARAKGHEGIEEYLIDLGAKAPVINRQTLLGLHGKEILYNKNDVEDVSVTQPTLNITNHHTQTFFNSKPKLESESAENANRKEGMELSRK